MILSIEALLHNDNRSIISLEENNRRYVILNESGRRMACFKIDGRVLIEGPKCDYVIQIVDSVIYTLVELKGRNRAHAAEQLLATLRLLIREITCSAITRARTVVSRVVQPAVIYSVEKQLMTMLARRKGDYIIRSRLLEERA